MYANASTDDLRVKRPFRLTRFQVSADNPEGRTLTVSRLEAGRWLELGVFGGEQVVRADPFDAIEIPLERSGRPSVRNTRPDRSQRLSQKSTSLALRS